MLVKQCYGFSSPIRISQEGCSKRNYSGGFPERVEDRAGRSFGVETKTKTIVIGE